MNLNYSFLVFSLILFNSSICFGQTPIQTELCKSLRPAGLIQHDAAISGGLKKIALSKESWSAIHKQRACLKAYSQGFPGGEDAFLHANSTALKSDLDNLTELFRREQSSVSAMPDSEYESRLTVLSEHISGKADTDRSLTNDDRVTLRIYKIRNGWDKNQVLLWGNMWYIRTLYKEGKYEAAAQQADAVRKVFNTRVAPIQVWDDAEENTYFSTQALANIIATLGYRAGATLVKSDPQKSKILVQNFAADRDALVPIFPEAGGDPTEQIRAAYCH
ncbi:hypothetical protein [Paraburkholderia sp. BR10882]|uniref:hypothetical protein n=1 Tax=unclassified Paraburkholderia TaxID=2615204 RepID=UPI0034CF2787